jgi:ADP-ribosyl-[dinitrogen reductase] hydrolase
MDDKTLLDKVQGAYAGLAIGDALGATVEFMTPTEIKVKYGVHKKITGGGWLSLKKGQVTDDTTMSLALGRAILESKKIDSISIARHFDEWMRSKPVDIGNTVRRGIVQYRLKGTVEMPYSDYDAGNGACMRTLPIALFTWGVESVEIEKVSRLHAHITHHNKLSDAGTECVIAMIHRSLENGTLTDLEEMAHNLSTRYREFLFNARKYENPSGYIVDTLQVVFQSLFDCHNFEDTMIDVVNRGGDADTTGAILGMIAGALYGLSAIPKQWIKSLNPDVLQDCLQQAENLIQLSPKYGKQISL